MRKFRSQTLAIIIIVALLSIVAILAITYTAEAGPTKYKVDWGWYKCEEIDTGVVCIPWVILIKVTPVEGWWHKKFGEHPHGWEYEYIEHNPRHQMVISCSKCDWQLGGVKG